MFHPKLFTTLKGYSRSQFISDIIAGLVVGVVAIPLSISFAIASGVSPEKGLITAIVAGLLISVFGGSRVQIGGPTGAFVVIIYGVVAKYGIDGLIVSTLLAGIFLIVMGLVKFGSIIKFMPHSVIVGFTSGIAMIIFSSQMKDFLGLKIATMPADFPGQWKSIIGSINTVNFYSLAIASATIVLIIFWPRVSRKIPGALIAIILSSIAVEIFKLPVETIGCRFGELPHTLPMPHFPHVDFEMIRTLFRPAFTIALLGAIESLLSAVVSDGMIGGKHRSNTELIGQGIANIASAVFGGIPATGAIARTVTNIRNGGRTPVAGIVHAFTVLLILLLFGRYIKTVPFACLAGILAVVAYNMSEWRLFRGLLQGAKGARIVLLSTFLVTVFIDLPSAIELGVVLSAFLFVKRMSELTTIKSVVKDINDQENSDEQLLGVVVPAGVQVYEINGPLFFGAANRFDEIDRVVGLKPKIRILYFKNVPLIDSTGMHALRMFYDKCKKSGIHLMITGIHTQPLNEMIKSNLYNLIGAENIFSNLKESIDNAKQFLENPHS
jgi:SulP family sulfate permease